MFLRRANRARAERAAPPADFMHLKAGRRYRVVRAFDDYTRTSHPVGETWIYVRHNYVPHERGLTLYVHIDGGPLSQIPLSWRGEDQGPIIDALADYVQPADT